MTGRLWRSWGGWRDDVKDFELRFLNCELRFVIFELDFLNCDLYEIISD
jgi:hypothetical protein